MVRKVSARTRILVSLSALAVLTALFALPALMGALSAAGLHVRTVSHGADIPNYDIRTDKTAFDQLAAFRTAAGKTASDIADARSAMTGAENVLKQRVPTLKVEYNDLQTPEVIGPDVTRGRAFLTPPTGGKRSDILKGFLTQNAALIGARSSQIAGLKVFADYTNPDGNLSFVELNQEVNGIPVFRGEVKAAVTKAGEIVRVINNFAPSLDHAAVQTDFGDPREAVAAAERSIKREGTQQLPAKNTVASTEFRTVFGTGDFATIAERIYFPTEPGVAVAAWRVGLWQPVDAYSVIIDAQSGTLLWRKNIAEDQTQSASYRVWAGTGSMINAADSPFPFTPGPTSPNGQQGAELSRSLITLIGNEPPYAFNNNGWITDGGNETDGNNVEAGLDRDPTQGVDAINGRAPGSSRVFDNPFSPYDPTTLTGDSPTPPGEPIASCVGIPQPHAFIDAQKAAVAQYFYVLNRVHDEYYLLGFTEQARNFQHLNFARGGAEGDRVSAESQDCSGTGGGNMATPTDGNRPRLQMFVWTGPPVDLDAAVDAEIVIHEFTHGMSNRLHGNTAGLTTNMARGMGEGWSDFYASSLLSQPGDPVNGVYSVAGYATSRIFTNHVNNYYYGIRRYPKAVLGFTGGVNNKPHNALTFSYANSNCDGRMTAANFAYDRGPIGTGSCDQVHNLGEIWSSALWEVRSKMVARLGAAEGNRRTLQLATDAMKMGPLAPTFLQGRDAILAAAQVAAISPETTADVADVWSGFAARGMGVSASIQNTGNGTGNTAVTEAFDLPNLFQSPSISITDQAGNNNGFPEPGETVSVNIPLTNLSGQTATGVTLQIVGGGNANYGTITGATTVSRPVSYTLPANAACGGVVPLTLNVTSSFGPTSFVRTFAVGIPNATLTENFDAVTPPAVPAGWSITSSYAPMTFVSTAPGADSSPVAMFAADLPNCTTGCNQTDGGSTELTSPPLFINAAAATVTFRHKYVTEAGWDGGVLEISIAGSAFQDIITAGGAFVQNGYNGTMSESQPNPLGGRGGWTGDSAGFITTIARLPAAAAGQNNVKLRWRFGADSNNAPVGGGWHVDSIQVAGSYTCSDQFPRSRADFDGDFRTDVSVYRPSDGIWYLNRSTQGFLGILFGIAEDIPTPGDFDDDGKADVAVWRPSTGVWYRLNSGNGSSFVFAFGQAGDIPQAGDFDGDGKDDIAVFRPSNGTWYWQNSSNGQFGGSQFGQAGDLPVAGDYDGDGRDDLAVFRPLTGVWYRLNSSNGQGTAGAFGQNGDLPVNADYDGDGRDDIAIFRPSDGVWYWQNSSDAQYRGLVWGLSGDVPVPGDYDGDGRDDQAVFRAGTWYLNRSTAGFTATNWGVPTDIPIPKKYIP